MSEDYQRIEIITGRCPPEDCGRIPGFYAFLDAVADPRHPDLEDMLDRYGEPFDPSDMDWPQIKKAPRPDRRPPQAKGQETSNLKLTILRSPLPIARDAAL